MINICLLSMQCRYSHSTVSLRILRNIAYDLNINNVYLLEPSIKEPIWKIVSQICNFFAKNTANTYNVLALSFYIWNRELLLEISSLVKLSNPNIIIVAGGPEISFDNHLPCTIDTIFIGEAEKTWYIFLTNLLNNHIQTGKIEENIDDNMFFNHFYSAYNKYDEGALNGKIIYLETSRGCPFCCSFCLSGSQNFKFRLFGMKEEKITTQYLEEFTNHLLFLQKQKVKCIKFLDRTFNADRERALTLFKICANIEMMSFHFEICAELIDDNTLSFLKTVEYGKFQFEIGVQSLNKKSLQAINRSINTENLITKIQQLSLLENLHIHSDLIFGLPLDNMQTITYSFNELFKLKLHEIQLGFLKFLFGTKLRDKTQALYNLKPPYEILYNNDLSYNDLLLLKEIEFIFNIFYNSGKFKMSLTYLTKFYSHNYFNFFYKLSQLYLQNNDLLKESSLNEQYAFLYENFTIIEKINLFYEFKVLFDIEYFLDCLRFDYISNINSFSIPKFLYGPILITQDLRTKYKVNQNTQLISFSYLINEQTNILSTIYEPNIYKISRKLNINSYLQQIICERLSSK